MQYAANHSCLLLSYLLMGKVYPVTESISSPKSLEGSELKKDFNSHYVLVKRKGDSTFADVALVPLPLAPCGSHLPHKPKIFQFPPNPRFLHPHANPSHSVGLVSPTSPPFLRLAGLLTLNFSSSTKNQEK